MRIDLNSTSQNELTSELSTQQASAQGAPSATQTTGTEDRATLSSDTVSLKSLVTAALSTPSRQNTVDSLKAAVSNGSYQVNPSSIAASMVDDYA